MRRGRPLAVYTPVHIDTKPVVGLMKLADGRWRASGPEKYTFTEPDEAQAIALFRAWEAKKNGQAMIEIEIPSPAPGTPAETLPAVFVIDPETGQAKHYIDEDAFWGRVRREILKRPQWVAERTGIEQIGYLLDLKPPEPLPTFEEVETVWKDHFRASDEQRRKVLHDWKDFVTATGVKTLKDITPEVVIAYRDTVYHRNITGKSQQNLFTRIRRLISFARSRAMAVEECGRVMQCLSLLVPSETTVSLDPKPILIEDWQELLKHARGDDRALILVMLNAAMYLTEATALRWKDIRGDYIVTHRAKTDRVVRVSVLWSETRAALAGVKRKGDYVFVAAHGGRLGVKGAERRWRALRKAAGVEEVTSSQIRDGAATAAAEAGVEPAMLNLLLGHRSGINDHYVKRRPEHVRPACDAVYKAYMSALKTPRSRASRHKVSR